MNKKIIKIALLTFFIATMFFVFNTKTSAVIEQYYGGIRGVNIQCTCSAASMVLVYDFRTKSVINLVYFPGYSRLYEYFNLYSSTYILGSYNPTIGAGLCLFTVGTGCVDASAIGLPAYGTMDFLPGAGTSLE